MDKISYKQEEKFFSYLKTHIIFEIDNCIFDFFEEYKKTFNKSWIIQSEKRLFRKETL